MKTTIFFLSVSFLLLTACQPRDPEVLSREDKDFIQNKGRNRNGDGKEANCKARIPQKLELAMGSLAEGRRFQALEVLKLGQKLAKAGEDRFKAGCVLARLSQATASSKQFQISYQQCKVGKNEIEGSLAGSAEMTLSFDANQELTQLVYSTEPLSEQKVKMVTIQVSKKGAKDTLFLRDQLDLVFEKSQDGFLMKSSESMTELRTGFAESATQVQISVISEGLVSEQNPGFWNSDVIGEARSLNSDCSGNDPARFGLVLKSLEGENNSYDYQLVFGRVQRKGQLVASESEIEAKSQNDKTKKEESVVMKRAKVESVTDLLPWEQWL